MNQHPTDHKQKQFSPGDTFDCDVCGLKSKVELNETDLECGSCGFILGQYDLVDYDRISYNEDGSMSGRGSGTRLGSRPNGSVIKDKKSGKAGNGKSWAYLSKINSNIAAADGPTRSKLEAIKLIENFATTRSHKQRALELLELGWPDKHSCSVNPRAAESPIWRSAHPYGVGSSAAACLHMALVRMEIDSKLPNWLNLCLPTVKSGNRNSYGFRCLKSLKQIISSTPMRSESFGVNGSTILARANLGETRYRVVISEIRAIWASMKNADYNLVNHARPVMAAICHMIAKEHGLKPSKTEIMRLFDVEAGYVAWIPRIKQITGQ
jgi:hypothetical protein